MISISFNFFLFKIVRYTHKDRVLNILSNSITHNYVIHFKNLVL
jgi:hypothetical protein